MDKQSKLQQVNEAIDTLAGMLQGLTPEQLAVLAAGKVNIETLAKDELSKRGLSKTGKWVGYGN